MSRRLLPTLVAGAALTLTACASGGPLTPEEVATAAEDALEQEVGARPDVSCPDELAREEGATTRCTLTAVDDPTELGVTVTVISTDGEVRLGVDVDDAPGS